VNPVSGALKFLASASFNVAVAFVFFLFAARYETPSFVGKVAIVQLLEVVAGSFLALLSSNLITREVSHGLGKGEQREDVVRTALGLPLAVSPALALLLLFPSYVKLSIPYLFLYLLGVYQAAVLTGLGKFTEVNVGNAVFTLGRWGFSVLAVVERSVTLLILVWTLGALARGLYYQTCIGWRTFGFSPSTFRSTFRTGLPLYLSNAVSFLSSQGDRVTTAYLLGSSSLGVYQLMSLISSVPNLILGSLASPLLSSSSFHMARRKDVREMASLSFRVYSVLSLPVAVLGVGVLPPLVSSLFPQYVSGLPSLEVLVLSTTAAAPFTYGLNSFLVAAKRDYLPFLYLGAASAAEVVITSYLLIPRFQIFGAAVSQVGNAVLASSVLLWLSLRQGVMGVGRREAAALGLIAVASLSLWAWWAALLLVLVGARAAGVVNRGEASLVISLLPPRLKGIGVLLRAISA